MLRAPSAVLLAIGLMVIAAGCRGGDATGPRPRITASLSCVGPNDHLFACDLILSSAGGFDVTLVQNACQAEGNRLRLTKPNPQVLTNNGCYEPVGKVWAFAGPFPAGTAIGMEVEAAELPNPPILRVTGSYPIWRIEFEDGYDTDFDDLVLDVRALPAP